MMTKIDRYLICLFFFPRCSLFLLGCSKTKGLKTIQGDPAAPLQRGTHALQQKKLSRCLEKIRRAEIKFSGQPSLYHLG